MTFSIISLVICILIYVAAVVAVYKSMVEIADDDEAYEIVMKALRKKLK